MKEKEDMERKNQAVLGLYINNNFVILHVFIFKM